MSDYGIKCNQAHAPFLLNYPQKTDLTEKNFEIIVKSIEAAATLGAEHIIIHAINVPANVNFEEYNLKFYLNLQKYSEEFGIKIAVENLFTYNKKCEACFGILHTPQILMSFLKKLGFKNFVACLDIGHCAITGTEPETFIENMDNKILKGLHVHDNDYKFDRHTLPFCGNINWSAVIRSLKKIDYRQDLTFEIFGFLNKFPDDMLFSALKMAYATGQHLKKLFDDVDC